MHINNSTHHNLNDDYMDFGNDVEAAIDDYFKGKSGAQ